MSRETSPPNAAEISATSLESKPSPLTPTFEDDLQLVAALRRGKEAAFVWLINQYHKSLIRMALIYVSNQHLAEELAQETWLSYKASTVLRDGPHSKPGFFAF